MGREARQRSPSTMEASQATAVAPATPSLFGGAAGVVGRKRVEVMRGTSGCVQLGRRCVRSAHQRDTRSPPSLWTASSVQQTPDNQCSHTARGSSSQLSAGRGVELGPALFYRLLDWPTPVRTEGRSGRLTDCSSPTEGASPRGDTYLLGEPRRRSVRNSRAD